MLYLLDHSTLTLYKLFLKFIHSLQICISFLLHLGLIVIPKSVSESRIVQNLKATEISLTLEEVDRLKALNKNLRLFSMDVFLPGVPQEILWDVPEDEAYMI